MKLHERLVMFSDAVFAIAITILAIELRPPHAEPDHLAAALWDMAPKIRSFAISFAVIGLYWLSHVRLFRWVAEADRILILLTLLMLALVSFLPFPTAVLGESGAPVAIVFYAATVAAAGLVQAAMWGWVWRHPKLRHPAMPPRALLPGLARALATALVFAATIPLAPRHPTAALFAWLAVPPILLAIRLVFCRRPP
ncbi:MAG: DUF1211 domain-containing protein [Acetobacteraceae bacterium]|nr:DUF1211 domain-containing protein [Acetobacteraceae bacterium]